MNQNDPGTLKQLPSRNGARTGARREEILWEEMRSVRDLIFRTLQWGVTVLASLQTAIFFLRKEVKDAMVNSIPSQLKATESLPIERYLVGTTILGLVSLICCYIVSLYGNRYRAITKQLRDSNCFGISYEAPRKTARYAVFLVFIAFPLLDIAIRLWVHIDWK